MKTHGFRWLHLQLMSAAVFIILVAALLMSSSHREAPLIANDPVADNTDLYAFRSPTNSDKIIIIANWIPFQLPQGGPNFYHFAKDVRYEINIDNDINTPGKDIVYRFEFDEALSRRDPATFFLIRLGNENLRTKYKVYKSLDGGVNFTLIQNDGIVPPPNVGPRSIISPVGLNASSYESLIKDATRIATTGEKIFAGPVDDPFFVDLGGIFDLGDAPRQSGKPIDGLKCINVSTIAMEIDISSLQKNKKKVSSATSILDPEFVVGVWAAASRRRMRVFNDVDKAKGTVPDNSNSGDFIQISRIGMPLTNEAVIPIAKKDIWNRLTPYDPANFNLFKNAFYNPELALYMDDSKFGGAVPAFKPLRVQRKSLGTYDFGNTHDGLYPLKGNVALKGTALDDAIFGKLLLPAPGSPRSVDLWPIFHTGVPNLRPYQLATGKAGNPLAAGKPFINNFLPNGGDMLRLNMAVPATPRTSKDFSSLGLVQAAVLGLTDSRYNTNKNLQFIPNMDGFPNGRRLEDDVTRIELQAVGGIVLAAIGLWYDDFKGTNPLTQDLLDVYGYSTGVEKNDTAFKTAFPFVQTPWAGTHVCDCGDELTTNKNTMGNFPVTQSLRLAAPQIIATASPNPVFSKGNLSYKVDATSQVQIVVYDISGKAMKVLADKKQPAGTYNIKWDASSLTKGSYFISVSKNGFVQQTLPLVKSE